LLRHVVNVVREKGYRLSNADMTIVAQVPKMAPHITAMREIIAQDCNVSLDDINVKATTTEKLGYTGRKEGIASHAVVLLEKL
ncbi:MAG TPA: 2-C-methyl-D-erythritol 2,4-cyclodiphosphate synthase, partial [Alteromonas macleodii]|nr:2-C-methyl-D-erythritol 2,4-cyclodiphosphate synthase [Alteromonas macleodii]